MLRNAGIIQQLYAALEHSRPRTENTCKPYVFQTGAQFPSLVIRTWQKVKKVNAQWRGRVCLSVHLYISSAKRLDRIRLSLEFRVWTIITPTLHGLCITIYKV
jgi:hypothetical protein